MYRSLLKDWCALLALFMMPWLSGCGGEGSKQLFSNPTNLAVLDITDVFQFDFGSVLIDGEADHTFTVVNLGKRDASDLSGTFTISAFDYKGGSFPGVGGTCQSVLNAKSSCTIVVTFSPGYADQFSEFINLNYFNGERITLSTTVELFGRGLAASAGTLDTTWQSTGLANLMVGSESTQGRRISILPDKRLLVAGHTLNGGQWDLFVVRLLSNGDLDTSFGLGGVSTIDFAGEDDYASSLLVQSDGKIVVGGRTFVSQHSQFGLWRLTAQGLSDTTFGNQGKVSLTVGSGDAQLEDVAALSDGSLVAAGSASSSGQVEFAAVKLLPNGSLDGGFGIGGKSLVPIGTQIDKATAVATLGNGKVLLAGYSGNGTSDDMAAVRLNANGSLDTAYGTGGKTVVDFGGAHDQAFAAALQWDGKWVLAGKSGNPAQFALTRLLSTGAVDTGFGTNGRVTTALTPDESRIQTLLVQTDGKLVAGGFSTSGTDEDFTVARYLMTGALDTTFGNQGRGFYSAGSQQDRAFGAALAANGKIVLTGQTQSGTSTSFLARIWP